MDLPSSAFEDLESCRKALNVLLFLPLSYPFQHNVSWVLMQYNPHMNFYWLALQLRVLLVFTLTSISLRQCEPDVSYISDYDDKHNCVNQAK